MTYENGWSKTSIILITKNVFTQNKKIKSKTANRIYYLTQKTSKPKLNLTDKKLILVDLHTVGIYFFNKINFYLENWNELRKNRISYS